MSEKFTFLCPCGEFDITAPVNLQGQDKPCPECGKVITIPKQSQVEEPVEQEQASHSPENEQEVAAGSLSEERGDSLELQGGQSAGEIVSLALRIVLSSHLWPLLAIQLLAAIPAIIVSLSASSEEGAQLSVFVALILLPVSIGATVRAIADIYQNKRIVLNECFATGFSRFFSIVGAGLLLYLLTLGVVMAGAACVAIVGNVLPMPLNVVVAGAVGIGFVWAGVRLLISVSLAFPIAVVERKGALASFQKSRELTQGELGRMITVYFLLGAVFFVLGAVLVFSYGGVNELVENPPVSYQVFSAVLNMFSGVLFSVCNVLFYFDLKKKKEFFGMDELTHVFD